MTERLTKFLLMLIVTPLLLVLMLFVMGLMLFLPLVALIYPGAIHINEGKT